MRRARLTVAIVPALFICAQASAQPSNPLVSERAKVSFSDPVMTLKGSGGWVRTPRPLLDFELRFEFRSATPNADPGLVFRSWIGRNLWPDRGVRLRLPTAAGVTASTLLDVRQEKAPILEGGSVDLRPQGEWQSVVVTAIGEQVRIVINSIPAIVLTTERRGGYVMFDIRKGVVELRNITLREVDVLFATDALHGTELEKRGGQLPEPIREVQPVYTYDAMRAKVQGVVMMDVVVNTDGTVGPVRVTRALHPDLDISAVAASKAWKFKPAVLNGNPVAVVVQVEMTFTLR